ncbi:MAG: DUF397 domain-containing protein [Pseudonocardiaceae bacterium]|nr:DUF397 domain-containing protein [Pseudonocardiaceae bacterium]
MSVNRVPANWRKSSYSQQETACVEVALVIDQAVGVRDSKNRSGGHLTMNGPEWTAFLAAVKDGRLNS